MEKLSQGISDKIHCDICNIDVGEKDWTQHAAGKRHQNGGKDPDGRPPRRKRKEKSDGETDTRSDPNLEADGKPEPDEKRTEGARIERTEGLRIETEGKTEREFAGENDGETETVYPGGRLKGPHLVYPDNYDQVTVAHPPLVIESDIRSGKRIFWCDLCKVKVSDVSWESHLGGAKHTSRLKGASEWVRCDVCAKNVTRGSSSEHFGSKRHQTAEMKLNLPVSDLHSDWTTVKCDACNLVYLHKYADLHYASTFHTNNVNGVPNTLGTGGLGEGGHRVPDQHCQICDIWLSKKDWGKHLTGKKHAKNVFNKQKSDNIPESFPVFPPHPSPSEPHLPPFAVPAASILPELEVEGAAPPSTDHETQPVIVGDVVVSDQSQPPGVDRPETNGPETNVPETTQGNQVTHHESAVKSEQETLSEHVGEEEAPMKWYM